ncbi:MAG: aminotransferase class I/II-fold pyridoxal phosphate-dependent enzyme [Emcibacteraceae bacterium]|nr:aminotransferase class I/II-fold pyridoxal phosphate-dependent enzyme [Emcibacteraceae bacterium]
MTKIGDNNSYGLTTKLLYSDIDLSDDWSVSPPIHQSVNAVAADAEEFADISSVPLGDKFYARHGNPTTSRLAKVISSLEGGESGIIFSSGMGAITTTLLSFLKAGDHVVAQTNHYMGTTEMVTHVLPKYGIETTKVDQRDALAFERAVKPNTRLILTETPVNPSMHITDLNFVSELAKSKGIITFCDNTFATPINQKPLEFGVDIVMHSATKYIGGHHDLLAGSITASQTIVEQIWDMNMNVGAIPSPFNSWLALRGIRTLELRVLQQNRNAQAIAELLEESSKVNQVYYPGLKSHPQHGLAQKQMSGFGGLLTFDLKGGYDAGVKFIESLKLARNAGSLGGVYSVIIQPASMFAGRLTKELLEEQGITSGLIRFAAGIENTTDILNDIEQALEQI